MKKLIIENAIVSVAGLVGVGIFSMLGTEYAIVSAYFIGAFAHPALLKLVQKKGIVK